VLSWWKYSSGSKRAHESDVADSSSVGSIARPMGRVLLKKGKGKSSRRGKAETLTMVDEECDEYKHFKEQKFEILDKIALAQQEAAKAHNEATRAQEEA
jgi:Ni,Fe-hydrogenase III large subunit